MATVTVLVRSDKLVEIECSEEQLLRLKEGQGKSLKDLYHGTVVNGLYLEACAFDGTQIVSWREHYK